MKSDNGAQLGRYEPPSVKCDGCGVVDGCDCNKSNCPNCNRRCYAAAGVSEFVCMFCGEIFWDES